jgi:hypothetical protein
MIAPRGQLGLAVLLAAVVSLGAMPAERQRGLSWVAGPTEVSAADFEPLAALRVNWIVQTPFGWQEAVDSPEVRLVTDGRIWWGERDVGIEETTRLARERGIRTLLKPHVWLRRRADGAWRGQIAMRSEEDWRRWFASYERFILHYAALAERLGIEALAVGTELHTTAVERPEDWRRLIARVRAVYSGPLTYSANWHREFQEVPFWQDLDWIGIQAYFPLAAGERPTVEELVAGWQPHLAEIDELRRRVGKPVVFTEVGYRSTPDAAAEPWRWPQRGHRGGPVEAVDLETQRRCYEAFFRAVWPQSWLAGAHFWKWYPSTPTGRGIDPDFTPQGKPALEVLRRGFRDEAPAPGL